MCKLEITFYLYIYIYITEFLVICGISVINFLDATKYVMNET